jgi:hypothetical protein
MHVHVYCSCLTGLPIAQHRMIGRWLNCWEEFRSRCWHTSPEFAWRVGRKSWNLIFWSYYLRSRDPGRSAAKSHDCSYYRGCCEGNWLQAGSEAWLLQGAAEAVSKLPRIGIWIYLSACHPVGRCHGEHTNRSKLHHHGNCAVPRGHLSYLLLYSQEKSDWRNLFCSWSGNR